MFAAWHVDEMCDDYKNVTTTCHKGHQVCVRMYVVGFLLTNLEQTLPSSAIWNTLVSELRLLRNSRR